LSGSPTALGPGENLLTSSFFFRLNENYGLRAYHAFDASTGALVEQDYSIFRDLRSWTAALTFQYRNGPGLPNDFTVSVSFWLKAYPRAGHGTEASQDPEASLPYY
jgi:hypothetical protein